MRTVDDDRSQIEARILRWAEATGRRIRIDCVGVLIAGGDVEAVITDWRSGRQGLWPVAWDVPEEPPLELLPLFRPPPKVQRSLFV
jgi:hypothetical protein